MSTNNLTQLKENVKTLNAYISKPNFYQELCDFSQNDIKQVIENLSKIIFYYLYSNDRITTYKVNTLFMQINAFQTQEIKYVIHPTNNFYAKAIKRNGINTSLPYIRIMENDLMRLAEYLSAFPNVLHYGIPLYTDIEEAIKKALFSPSIIYESILKQPRKQELPISVGEAENTYYYNVFQKRLSGASTSLVKTSATIGKRVLSKMIGQNPLLAFFQLEQIPSIDVKQGETALHISANKIAFLEIPTYYALMNICAQNKGLKEGTKINYRTGELYTEPQVQSSPITRHYYNRYEKISVTEEFEYQNSEFTGDTYYDIDLIYGSLDSNNSRENLGNNFDVNYARIKKASDIKVRKEGAKYTILNGRHRLLYLKYFYLTNYKYYSEAGQLEKLKEKAAIPMLVEHPIENPEFVKYLDKISTLASFSLLKNDIRNDNLEFFLVFADYVYFVQSVEEIADLYSLLATKKYLNQYYIGTNAKQEVFPYEELMRRLIITLKKEIESMTFIDLINYIKTNREIRIGLIPETESLNYAIFHHVYINFLNKIAINKIYDRNIDIVADTIREQETEKIGQQIMEFLNLHPDYTQMTWSNLFEILHQIPAFSNYDSDYLRECANAKGYQTKLLKIIYNDDYQEKKLKP